MSSVFNSGSCVWWCVSFCWAPVNRLLFAVYQNHLFYAEFVVADAFLSLLNMYGSVLINIHCKLAHAAHVVHKH